MKKIFLALIAAVIFFNLGHAQNDTMYIMKTGKVIGKYKVANVDSVIFYKPLILSNINIQTANIPAGTFIMGSPKTEELREINETQFQVTLSAFKMSKYEITNAQYAAFLNNKEIAYPAEQFIFSSNASDGDDWGLHYTGGVWVPVSGYENHPVIKVTWLGAKEFATYVGGRLPTEAEWEYACRAGTNTPFNTGYCLGNSQANYFWGQPYDTCTNTVKTYPATTQTVGSYPPNAYGLYDMHGNVIEWCNDLFGPYPATAQTNPTGASSGIDRVVRGGEWSELARFCRSASRINDNPAFMSDRLGFRVILP